MWRCPRCETFNDDQRITCEVCSEPNPLKVKHKTVIKESVTVSSTSYKEDESSKHVESENEQTYEKGTLSSNKNRISIIPIICLILFIIGTAIVVFYSSNIIESVISGFIKNTKTPIATPMPSPAITPTPMPTSTLTPTPALTPTSTPTPTPAPTPTPTSTPTPTPAPTSTPTPTPAPTPTPTPTPTLTPTPTPLPVAYAKVGNYSIGDYGNGTCIIRDYTGSETELVVPMTLDGCRVVAIDHRAFDYCRELASIILPNTVASIADGAFSGCEALVSISLPDDIKIIAESTFSGCSKLAQIELPDRLEYIGDYAFKNCKSLEAIVLPDNLVSIGNDVFDGCYILSTVNFPQKLTSIGDRAFFNCDALKSIQISDSVTYIGSRAFGNCDELVDVSLPGGLLYIGEGAFFRCENLRTLRLPDSLMEVGGNIAFDCKKLEEIIISAHHPVLFYQDGLLIDKTRNIVLCGDPDMINARIPEGIKGVAYGAFWGCKQLSTISFPESMEWIGEYSFYSTGLTNAVFPNELKSIGEFAFAMNKQLKSIGLNEGLERIDRGAFSDCPELETVFLPNSVTFIGSAFDGCPNMQKEVADYSITAFSNDACIVNRYIGSDDKIAIPERLDGKRVVAIGDNAFSYSSSEITKVNIPDSVRHIGSNAFAKYSLKEVDLPKSLISLDYGAFYGCENLTRIELPQGLKTIGSRAFDRCKLLNEIIIPDSVTEIGEYAFYICSGITEIRIPNSITRIEDGLFAECSSLQIVHIPSSVTEFGVNIFNWSNNICEIHGKKGSAAEAYANETGILFIPDSDDEIEGKVNSFPAGTRYIDEFRIEAHADGTCGIIEYTGQATKLNIPTYIGEYRVTEICDNFLYYSDKPGIVQIMIPEGVTKIGNSSMIKTKDLVEISIPDSAVSLNPEFITFCRNLETIHISSHHPVLWLEDGCLIDKKTNTLMLFYGDQTEVVVPDGIKAIGVNAFYSQEHLSRVVLPDSVVTINDNAFYACDNLKSIVIPASVTYIGKDTFSFCKKLTVYTDEMSATMQYAQANQINVVTTALTSP